MIFLSENFEVYALIYSKAFKSKFFFYTILITDRFIFYSVSF